MNSTVGSRGALMKWGAEASGILIPRFWGFFLAAFVLATGFAEQVYTRLDLPQKYSELIAGAITWSYQNKFHDYAVLYALVFAFLVALALIASTAALLARDAGIAAVDRLHDFILILCAPAVLWFAGLLTTKSPALDLLNMSQVLLLVGLVLSLALIVRRPKFWGTTTERLFDTLHRASLFVVLATLAVAAVGVASNRLGARAHASHWMTAGGTAQWMGIVACCAVAVCLALVALSRDPERLARSMRRLVMAAQWFMPLFFLCLIPPAWIWPTEGTLAAGYRLTAFAKILVVGCIAAAYFELYLRARRERNAPAPAASALQLLTVGAALGLLLFLKTPPYPLPQLDSDDYHFGEMLVPWWSWFEMGLLPFWDYAPARGLMNYFPGLLVSLLFGGAPGALGATYPFIYAALAVVAIPVLRRSIGMGGAFVALLFGPFANGIGEIDLAVSIFLFAFCWGWLHWRWDRWLAALAAAAVFLLLFAPGQGALALLASAPLALAALWHLYRADRGRLLRTLLAIFAALAMLFTLTPLGKMVFGALRYGAEQSQINSIAHGIQWSASFGAGGLGSWAFELVRASFLLAALWAGVLVLKAMFLSDAAARRRILVYAVPVLLISLLFVIRAAGRIDADNASRLGIASVWALSLLLPLLLFVSVRVRAVHILAWIGLMGLLLPHAGSLSSLGYAGNFNAMDATALERRPNARSIENGRLGPAIADAAHLARIVAVRKLLDQVLDAQETYLDLSGRHAMYYYVDRKPVVESASTYNLVGERQQLRAIRAIRAARVPAILLSADNILHDGGPSSLRANLMYREVLLSKGYKLVTIDKQIWMIRDDRVARLAPGQVSSVVNLDGAAVPVLDPVYRLQNLEALPASWGRSARSLAEKLAPVADLSTAVPVAMHSVRALGGGRYAITGEDPHLRFDLSSSRLGGQRAGILSFEFSCASPQPEPRLGLYWATPDQPEGQRTFMTFRGIQGRLLVPVDSAPSWLLADRIDSIRFDLDSGTAGCEEFSIRNVVLMARTATLH